MPFNFIDLLKYQKKTGAQLSLNIDFYPPHLAFDIDGATQDSELSTLTSEYF